MKKVKIETPEHLKEYFKKRISERDEQMKKFREVSSKKGKDIVGSRMN